eukprot:1455177-Prymnesium_polylepis.1
MTQVQALYKVKADSLQNPPVKLSIADVAKCAPPPPVARACGGVVVRVWCLVRGAWCVVRGA